MGLMSDLEPLADELPPGALSLLGKHDTEQKRRDDALASELGKLDAWVNEETAKIREKAEREIEVLRKKHHDASRKSKEKLLAALKPMQEELVREGKLDEALAVRAEVRRLRAGTTPVVGEVRPDPGNVRQLTSAVG